MKVPLNDLEAQYQSIKNDIDRAIESVVQSKKFIQGDHVRDFEQAFCEVHGGKFALGCSSGTSAITIALAALGIGAGDEVIVPSFTFFASLEAVITAGAKPVIVDIRPDNYCMDPIACEKAITPQTKAILPVHLYGHPCDMHSFKALADKHSLRLIEDSAQAHMGTWQGQAIGTFGDAATFSFYPGKNLGAYGDAGMVLFAKPEHREYAAKYIDHGRVDKYNHEFYGRNDRMDGIQAAILQAKLPYLNDWTNARIHLGQAYDERLQVKGFKVSETHPDAKHVRHCYVVEVSNRDKVLEHLKSKNIGFGVHYPIPMHLLIASKDLGYSRGDFPVAENVSERILSLPIYPEMTLEQLDYVCKCFLEVAQA